MPSKNTGNNAEVLGSLGNDSMLAQERVKSFSQFGETEPSKKTTLCSEKDTSEVSTFSKVVELPQQSRRAYELLAAQPATLAGLNPLERSLVVVTAIADDQGREHVVSRFGDPVWDLQSILKPQNVKECEKVIKWSADLPQELLMDAKAVCYVWMKRGKPGGSPVSPQSLKEIALHCCITMRFLAARGIQRFSQVREIDIIDCYNHFKYKERPPSLEGSVVSTGELRSCTTINNYLQIFELVRVFAGDVLFPLQIELWEGKSLGKYLGRKGNAGTGKTPVIPPSIVQALFNHAELVLKNASTLNDLRDPYEFSELGCKTDLGCRSKLVQRFTEIRDAVLFLLEITTGMRNSEATALKNDSWRSSVDKRTGITHCWVETVEFKTGKGRVDFLAPPELLPVLDILQRWVKPYQDRLQLEINWLEKLLSESKDDKLSNGFPRVDALQRLARARNSVSNLFLSYDGKGLSKEPGQESGITVISNQSCNNALQRLAKAAGVKWRPKNHECRRTFAWTIAQSRIGRYALIFLKWQLKHSTISMSQLYAANVHQSQSLYDDLYEEIVAAQVEVMEDWFDAEAPLAGGAGKRIKDMRGTAIKNRKSLLKHTAEHVNIRNNGHAWCLAEERGCGGEGIYEAGKCSGCTGSVIDESHISFWQNIHLLNLELLNVDDCGDGVRKRAERECEISEGVLRELGVKIPQPGDKIDNLDVVEA